MSFFFCSKNYLHCTTVSILPQFHTCGVWLYEHFGNMGLEGHNVSSHIRLKKMNGMFEIISLKVYRKIFIASGIEHPCCSGLI